MSRNIFEIRTIALANVVERNFGFYYRKICRWYSQSFSTPLREVEKLDPDYVLLHYFEDYFQNISEEDKLYNLYKILDPNFDENEEAEIEDFVKKVEAQALAKKEAKQNTQLKQQSSDQGSPEGKVRNFEEPPPPDTVSDDLDSLIDITKVDI